ncbi:hypothetical protein GYMLUDRAFT_45077 [Collybiopsis luxurians FD-317 M1]|uniref:Uncharacterized protein n=1 Tax=Collybiopsis luxurians FD-317 M1 TaxID=944289 RepID=A0A0D0BTK5_9AGAR|nr:hypothetical protein GYMLUDRAFT_45077 [Collybiopsis luxurians FD-317 M1]
MLRDIWLLHRSHARSCADKAPPSASKVDPIAIPVNEEHDTAFSTLLEFCVIA